MPEETTVDPQEEATPAEGEVSTPEPEGATETEAEESAPVDQVEPSQEDVDYKTRWQASSEEGRKLDKEKKVLETELEGVRDSTLKFITANRQRFTEYLDGQADISQEDKTKYLSAYDAENPPQEAAPVQGQTRDPLDPYRDRVIDDAANKLQGQVESRRKASQKFIESEEGEKLSPETLGAIWPLAFKLETEDGLDPDAAITKAKSVIVGQNEVENQSYAKGLSDALLGDYTAGVSGGSGGSKDVDQLPPRHEKFVTDHIKGEGLKGEAADDFRKGYVERLIQKRII